MTELQERNDSILKGLRVFVQFSPEELQKRRYLLPTATITKSLVGSHMGSEAAFHVLHLDGEESFTPKGEPLLGKPRLRREWIIASSTAGVLEKLVKRSAQSEQIEVMLYVKRDRCIPCSETLDVGRDLLEICPGVVSLMPDETRGQTEKVVETRIEGRTLRFGVDTNEWEDLYEGYEGPKEARPHKVRLNTLIEVQLTLGPKAVLHHWNNQSPKAELENLGINQASSGPERKLVQLKADSNLYYFAGSARRIVSQRYFDPTWQKEAEARQVLLDCGLPVVFVERIDPGESSSYVQKEGEFLMGLCYLIGSISFSGTSFRTPLVGRVLAITEMNFVPPFVLLEVELKPVSVVPEVRISYYAKEQKPLKGVDLSGYIPPAE